jgi:probable F420-dependent oxidoreductase
MPYIGNWYHPVNEWKNQVQWYEKLGYDTVYQCDHFYKYTYDPIVMLSSCATATKKIHFGSLVFDIDYRHPIILAKAAATLHLLSHGRFELGLGAGWQKRDYISAGIPFDLPRKRIERLEEAIQVIKSLWINEKTTFKGKHYRIRDAEKAGNLEDSYPRILIGGGGKKVLSVAGRHADIVGINMMVSGDLTEAIKKESYDSIMTRIDWVNKAALKVGRDPDCIEYHVHIPWIIITDDSIKKYEETAKSLGLSVVEAMSCPKIMIGSVEEISEKIELFQSKTGIRYFSLGLSDRESIKTFSEKIIFRYR